MQRHTSRRSNEDRYSEIQEIERRIIHNKLLVNASGASMRS
jgi:hypothetical protein